VFCFTNFGTIPDSFPELPLHLSLSIITPSFPLIFFSFHFSPFFTFPLSNMSSATSFTFNDLVFTHETNSVSVLSRSTQIDDLLADLEPTSDISFPLDFSLSSDSWHLSICFHFSQLTSIRGTPSLSLFHAYHIGQLLHEEELRMLGRLSPTAARSRKNSRRLHSLFTRTVKHLPGCIRNHYQASRRTFALYKVLDPQAMQAAQVITPSKLRQLSKQDFSKLYDHAKNLGQASPAYPYHLSVFIGTTEH